MSVQNVLRELAGIYPSDSTQLTTDVEDVFSDEVLPLPMALDAAAGTDTVYASFKAPFAFRVVEAVICPGAALTAADATANTITLGKADGAGGGSTVVASLVTNLAGGNWVADVFKPMTLSATFANTLVARGQIVTLKKTHAGAGTVGPASTCSLKIRRV